tara:strand:+ start:16549 stop:16944 length:396 start_codon:yes stop_codon:yes gene_type:complete
MKSQNENIFRADNTQGYSGEQLQLLNREWSRITEVDGIDESDPRWKSRQEKLLRDFDQTPTGSPGCLENRDIVIRTTITRADGEYHVKAYGADGRRIAAADYFTPDEDDARDTSRWMLCRVFNEDPTTETD